MLSIITPTYNRAYLLPQLYQSLLLQTSKDFEWIVVDDGSTDETEEIVEDWNREGALKITYKKKENGGKHTALNYAHPYINSDIVLIADSDDWLVEDAVETIVRDWKKYRNDPHVSGLCYLRGADPTHSLGDFHFKEQEFVSDYIKEKVSVSNDFGSCEVIKTNILKEFPFPETKGEKFIGESYLWIQVGLKYKTVFIDKILYITQFYEDGLTRGGRKLRINNPMGGYLYQILECREGCLSRIG